MMYRALVVKPTPCCGAPDGLGLVFEVLNEYPASNGNCRYCGHVSKWYMAAVLSNGSTPHRSRLKPLPPESECLEEVEAEIELPKTTTKEIA